MLITIATDDILFSEKIKLDISYESPADNTYVFKAPHSFQQNIFLNSFYISCIYDLSL